MVRIRSAILYEIEIWVTKHYHIQKMNIAEMKRPW